MKNLGFLLLILSMALVSCQKEEFASGTPKCIKKEIRKHEKRWDSLCDTLWVKEYRFQEESVFLFGYGRCTASDLAYPLWSKDCEKLGSLGGIMGNQKINGEDFDNAVFVKTVWEKN